MAQQEFLDVNFDFFQAQPLQFVWESYLYFHLEGSQAKLKSVLTKSVIVASRPPLPLVGLFCKYLRTC